ncbi:hypothetical protein [Mesorhizobium sp. M1396]|uniref:hypothetical protein n=1 Tax=Mesorhizobium sp. M1396 TaxID=2957095 RepID=UPI00333B5820
MASSEFIDAYHSFAMAVGNEERAFAFWSDVAANATLTEVQSTAEQMARGKLEHARIPRVERRRAFLSNRESGAAPAGSRDFAAMEEQIATRLDAYARFRREDDRPVFCDLAAEARNLAQQLIASPLGTTNSIGSRPPGSLDAFCEFAAESYVNTGDTLASQADRDRAQILATSAIRRLATLRYIEERQA